MNNENLKKMLAERNKRYILEAKNSLEEGKHAFSAFQFQTC